MNEENKPASILIVEDSDEDFFTLMRIFKKLPVAYPVTRCIRGEQTLDLLYRHGEYQHLQDDALPSLILLDLNLIGLDGRVVLARIKKHPHLRKIPVVVLTTSSNPKDIEFCYDCGANSYLLKPVHLDRFTKTMQVLISYWFDAVVLP
ncbi:response regulator [Dictyobacter kobayashii]|uniref:Response regulator n=1 Tax=Dictyobacter kobayashii TaxID=2014872 RepID=A0A402ATS0_9CHLR|nr:response regulator [Dictyobacter kobayashii]GCE22511.1 response regulator [Dictyobacter kobayashii]